MEKIIFCDIVETLLERKVYKVRDMAEALSVSLPTIRRYAKHKSAPHSAIRESMIRWLWADMYRKFA